ncbi:MAG: LysE family translocator, partial [Rhizobiales bacterium]|nr:LysE family translocator [Hyphomicrobiales bacterium]
MTIEFWITSLIVIVSPGTGVLYTLAAGLSRGARASVVAAFGCTLGIVPHMAAAILGVAALLHTSALAFQTFKWLGVAYLLYLAWSALKERGALRVDAAPQPVIPAKAGNVAAPQQTDSKSAPHPLVPAEAEGETAQHPFVPAKAGIQEKSLGPRLRGDERGKVRADLKVTVEAILINILNPKLSIFFFAFLPQFVDAGEPHPLAHMTWLSVVFMMLTFVVFVGYGLFAASIREHVISRPRVL